MTVWPQIHENPSDVSPLSIKKGRENCLPGVLKSFQITAEHPASRYRQESIFLGSWDWAKEVPFSVEGNMKGGGGGGGTFFCQKWYTKG